jgi:hypothetical protein
VQTKYFAIQMSQVPIHIPSFTHDFSRGFFLPLITLSQVYAGTWPPLHWSDADGLLIHMHVPHRKVTVDFSRFSLFLVVDLLKDRDVLLFVMAHELRPFVNYSEC